MAFCIKCGKEIPADAKFCAACGTAVNTNTNSPQDKTVYDGKLHKCPNCGELLEAFVTTCPVCKYELRSTNATSYVHEFSLKIEKTEDIEQKIELIKNFYIPNTKEDIYEFFILAASNITVGGYAIDAWLTKFEQTYLKAQITFGDSDEFKYIKNMYDSIHKKFKRNRILQSKNFKASIIFSVGIVLILVGLIVGLSDYDWTPFVLVSVVGFIPFVVGLIMLIMPARKSKHRKI